MCAESCLSEPTTAYGDRIAAGPRLSPKEQFKLGLHLQFQHWEVKAGGSRVQGYSGVDETQAQKQNKKQVGI